MATRAIASFTSQVQQNCAWGLAIHFTNTDGSDFDLTPYSSLTFQVRATPGYTVNPLAVGTVTITSPTGGLAVLGLSAKSTGSLPATGSTFDATTPAWAEVDGIPTADATNPIRLAQGVLQVSPGGNAQQSSGTAPTTPSDTIVVVVGITTAGIPDVANKRYVTDAQLALLQPATPSSSGAMSAAQNNLLATLAPGGFLDRVALVVAGITNTVTSWRTMLPPTTGLTDAGIKGQGYAAAGGAWIFCPGGNVLVNQSLGAYAVAARIKFPTPAAGQVAFFGIRAAASDRSIGIETSYGTSHTNLVLAASDTVHNQSTLSTFAVDANLHDMIIIDDGVLVYIVVDGATVGTMSNRSAIDTGPGSVAFLGLNSTLIFTDVAFGWG